MGVLTTDIWSVDQVATHRRSDELAVEEPLEIKLVFGPEGKRETRTLAITMRTPGHDFDLVTGFLFTEGIIASQKDIRKIVHAPAQTPEERDNVVVVDLAPHVPLAWEEVNRHFYTSSSCGVCGKGSIEMVRMHTCYFPIRQRPQVTPEQLFALPEILRAAQTVFASTGGIHGVGLFSPQGELLAIREDIGRHNALDKLIGQLLKRGDIPMRDGLLVVSGRASFELVQKALMAGIPILIAVGAPSSLALELAEENGMTLIGFLRQSRFNVYTGPERIIGLI
jgi:FdhD protein